jgi:hypothetical protein
MLWRGEINIYKQNHNNDDISETGNNEIFSIGGEEDLPYSGVNVNVVVDLTKVERSRLVWTNSNKAPHSNGVHSTM